MTEKLNPCRKCGKQPQVDDISYRYHGWDDHAHWVICPRTCGNTGEIGESDSEAIRLWNAANPIAPQPAEKIDLAKFEGHEFGPCQVVKRLSHDEQYGCVGEVVSVQIHGRVFDITSSGMGNEDPAYKDLIKVAAMFAAAPDLLAEVKQSRERIAEQEKDLARLRQQIKKLKAGLD